MRAIILAAGRGTRIAGDIGHVPKSTLPVKGKPIIRNTVEILNREGVEAAVCTGYRRGQIEEVLAGLPVAYFHNPFYEVTNNIASLWFSLDFLRGQDTLIMSADVVAPEEMLCALLHAHGDLVMASDASRVGEGDYFLSLGDDGQIKGYGPDIDEASRDSVNVGICRVSAAYTDSFRERVDRMVSDGNYQAYFENAFFSYIGSTAPRLSVFDVSGYPWTEVDRISDYRRAVKEAGGQGVRHERKS